MTKINPLLPANTQSFADASISFIVGKPLSAGRAFSISFTDESGAVVKTTVKFKELVDQFAAISKEDANEDLITEIYTKLKTVNQDANRVLKKKSGWYRFKTGFHRLSNLFRKDHDVYLNRILEKKHYALPITTTWYDDLIQNLSDYKGFGTYTLSLQLAKGKMIEKRYNKLKENHPELELMGNNISGKNKYTSFKMEGLAIIGSYLKQKHGLNNLFVCDSLEAFQHQLKIIAETPGDLRASLIVPVRGMGAGFGHVPENQHKATVGIEKIGDHLKIIYLDGDPAPIDETLINKPAKDLIDCPSTMNGTPVFWNIMNSGLEVSKIELFRSTPKREFGPYGCETIALRDAVDFLNTPDFFTKVQISGEDKLIKEVDVLPPNFMKVTQSTTALKKYKKAHPEDFTAPIQKSRSGVSSLKKTMKHHSSKGYDSSGSLRRQNHYVSFRSLKYHMMALEAMKQMSTDDLKNIIADTFIRVERPSLQARQEPQTIYDLFENFWKPKPTLTTDDIIFDSDED